MPTPELGRPGQHPGGARRDRPVVAEVRSTQGILEPFDTFLLGPHADVGRRAAAEALGVYAVLVAGTNRLPDWLRFQRYKPWMRTVRGLWWVVVVQGLLPY